MQIHFNHKASTGKTNILKLCFPSARSVILVVDDGSEGALAQAKISIPTSNGKYSKT